MEPAAIRVDQTVDQLMVDCKRDVVDKSPVGNCHEGGLSEGQETTFSMLPTVKVASYAAHDTESWVCRSHCRPIPFTERRDLPFTLRYELRLV